MKTKLVLPLVVCIAIAALAIVFTTGCGEETVTTTTNEVTVNETSEANWSTDIDHGDIPDTPIAGKINGQDVTIANVSVTKWDDSYDWEFSTAAPDEACGVVIDNDAVNFSSKVLQTGTFEKTMDEEIEFDDYHAYYHYEQDDGTPMSVNVDWSAKLVVDEVDEENNKVTGWAEFDFSDEETMIEGSFEADLCE
jgi:hypothetical protein